ncbi:hypothetical protein D3C72_1123030 [compost metagenome]
MRLGQQEELAVDGVAQLRQLPVAEFRQQHHAVGFQVADHPRPAGNQLVCPAIFRLLLDKADGTLLQLLAQQAFVEHLQLGHHHLHQQLLQAQPHGALLRIVVAVPVDHFVVEPLAATANRVSVNRGAQADARGLDGLVGHEKQQLGGGTRAHVSPLSNQGHSLKSSSPPYVRAFFAVESSRLFKGNNVRWKLFSKRHEHSSSGRTALARAMHPSHARASPHQLPVLQA